MTKSRDRWSLAAMVFAVLLAQVLLYPGVDRLVGALGATTDLDASMWFLAAEFAAFVAFAGVWGAASDRAGRRTPFIAAGAFGGSVGYLALALVPGLASLSFGAVLALRALQGAATIGAFSLAMTMLMDLEGGHGRNMAAAGAAIGGGTAMGAPLGGQLYEVGAFVPLYLASALLAAVGLLALAVDDRAPSGDRDSLARAMAGLRRTPTLFVPYAFGFLDRLTAGFFALVGTLYFRSAAGFGLDPGATGLMLALFFAPFALLQYPMGILSDRIGRTVPIVAGSACYGLVVIAIGRAPTAVLAGAGMLAVGVLGALMSPATMALVTDLASERERGVAMAGFNVFGSLGFLAGVVVGGSVASAYDYPTAFLVAGGLEIVVALVTLPVFLRLNVGRTATFAD
ncbi:MFS transporter [Halosimplex aquaticum]|uniref:MFS transporter n=1 Tax=Halosimplex aquaticum TaxID=3026162 RepID=A0ABD5Y0A7_9EURY|nr:MFS transporter [Halosimplex aquaticum]